MTDREKKQISFVVILACDYYCAFKFSRVINTSKNHRSDSLIDNSPLNIHQR